MLLHDLCSAARLLLRPYLCLTVVGAAMLKLPGSPRHHLPLSHAPQYAASRCPPTRFCFRRDFPAIGTDLQMSSATMFVQAISITVDGWYQACSMKEQRMYSSVRSHRLSLQAAATATSFSALNAPFRSADALASKNTHLPHQEANF